MTHQKATATTQRKDFDQLQAIIGTKAARDDILNTAKELESVRAFFRQKPELIKDSAHAHLYVYAELYAIKAWVAFVFSDRMQKATPEDALFGNVLAAFIEEWEYLEGIERVK
jgi:hypothetical protein